MFWMRYYCHTKKHITLSDFWEVGDVAHRTGSIIYFYRFPLFLITSMVIDIQFKVLKNHKYSIVIVAISLIMRTLDTYWMMMPISASGTQTQNNAYTSATNCRPSLQLQASWYCSQRSLSEKVYLHGEWERSGLFKKCARRIEVLYSLTKR